MGAGEGVSGYDAGKKIKGRKRHILADTQGLLPGVLVTPASVQDRDAARVVFCVFCHLLLTLRIIFADGGHAGKLEGFVAAAGQHFGHAAGLVLSIIKRSDTAKGFVLLPKRWVVERTFGWLVKARRLVRDHERNQRHHETLVYLAMIGNNARHLTSYTARGQAGAVGDLRAAGQSCHHQPAQRPRGPTALSSPAHVQGARAAAPPRPGR